MRKTNIILASASAARQSMLHNAGVDFECLPADIDEKKIIADLEKNGASVGHIALTLAKEKALKISKKISNENPDVYVIGSDQVLSMEDKIYNKAQNKSEAIERLKYFGGKQHFLTSAVCVYKDGEYLWHKTDVAALDMKPLSDDQLKEYGDKAGDILTQCVGCYAIEGLGIRLFDRIEGNHYSIMGMPLLPLLNYLEKIGVL
jgi:septum formation protein